ncbi:pre-peptidase C-terminal domain-containing protein [Zooshikella harenae]|uniref:Pre-peptidase C-terminal domain-containing protein n=1 Tax=Zooshikella harenae TaxID=2827238 RepID=A0ABS5ZH06_9GAMM|nr:pre-peptidase C-terminal domain-containing protein [Zooshikella harenae]MBU2713260.1 pre-peptidase C-terminal domain-containing protein [Zooshikella harenae]
MKSKAIKYIIGTTLVSHMVFANSPVVNPNSSPYLSTDATSEEQRLSQITDNINNLIAPYKNFIQDFNKKITNKIDYKSIMKYVKIQGNELWNLSKINNNSTNKDDRSLYWVRLYISYLLRNHISSLELENNQRIELFWNFELASRGNDDINFKPDDSFKVLLTGFDPFGLDYQIEQSNPSGYIALSLDGKNLNINDKNVSFETLILPVRFEDFDRGMVETMLESYIKNSSVDMIITSSMGREDRFDLERFPALRRSAKSTDNTITKTGASQINPLKPFLNGNELDGPEFVEFSLPAKAILKSKIHYQISINKDSSDNDSVSKPYVYDIVDNRTVKILERKKVDGQIIDKVKEIPYVKKLESIINKKSVSGSSGSFLSNEITYRSIRLRNIYASSLPIGHIHTPYLDQSDLIQTEQNNVPVEVQQYNTLKQTKSILSHAIKHLIDNNQNKKHCKVKISNFISNYNQNKNSLENCTFKHNISSEYNTKYYWIYIPQKTKKLKLSINGNTGNADLYVSQDTHGWPTQENHDYSSITKGSTETINIENPTPNHYYHIAIKPSTPYKNISIKAELID